MSETDTQTSLQGDSNSVAEELKKSGFRKTGIARAVAELVGEYLGFHAHISPNLAKALGNTNSDALQVLGPVAKSSESTNDSHFLQQKTGTHG